MSNTQILEEAAEWLVALRGCAADAPARAQFAAWLCKSPEHVSAYLELSSIWADAAAAGREGETQAQGLIARARADDNVVELQDVRSARSEGDGRTPGVGPSEGVGKPAAGRFARVRRRGLFAAALATALVAGGGAWWQTYRFPTYEAGVGEQRSFQLADGSVVELNSRSRIRIRYSQDQRLVELLEGQGLFLVEKDPQRPFVVRSNDVHVRAVGTQFDVYRKPQGTVVTVIEGRVEIRAASGPPLMNVLTRGPAADEPRAPGSAARSAMVELGAGEQVLAADGHIAEPTTANLAAATAWTDRQLVFDSAPLSEVAREFNRYNVRKLVIRDAQMEKVLISGVFSSAEPSSLLRFLREQPDLEVEEAPWEIRISSRR